MKFLHQTLTERKMTLFEYLLIFVTAIIPLFFNHPYRINLFLAWEGAFRIASGEIPYRDFGSPVGYAFWLLPALFFKIFGPYVYTLLVVQAFINIVSGTIFRGILKLFVIPAPVRLLSLLVFCLSYSMFNFWPWYNHLVFVFEIAGLYFLCTAILKPILFRKNFNVVLSAFFIALSFMTKQDTGALGFCIAIALLIFDFILERNFKTALIFIASYLVFMAILIVPFLQYEFSYWFNMGQFPHYARVDKFDIISEFLGGSDAIKFYLLFIIVIVVLKYREAGSFKADKTFFIFAFLVICILGQATIIQVTSYTPLDGNIYFHSFAFAFLMCFFSRYVDTGRVWQLSMYALLVCLWWSGVFWNRFLKERVQKILVDNRDEREHVISKRTYLLSGDTTLRSNRSKWIVPDVASFKNVRVPESTAEGIQKIMELPESKNKNMKMLNMSELTPLAYDMGYELEKGPSYPLWFHKGVSFFDREVDYFCDKISNKEYDLILFEDIPNVNQFYPYEVQSCIKQHYKLKFKFLAPRVPEICYIEVYTKQ
ncbi:MAG TPA: hypothetical protein VD884_01735 [Ohtaekwangia sp.]|nr:hypothetical protein [Ohtaekwangia sp.]